jgi:hypothetical protein
MFDLIITQRLLFLNVWFLAIAQFHFIWFFSTETNDRIFVINTTSRVWSGSALNIYWRYGFTFLWFKLLLLFVYLTRQKFQWECITFLIFTNLRTAQFIFDFNGTSMWKYVINLFRKFSSSEIHWALRSVETHILFTVDTVWFILSFNFFLYAFEV